MRLDIRAPLSGVVGLPPALELPGGEVVRGEGCDVTALPVYRADGRAATGRARNRAAAAR